MIRKQLYITENQDRALKQRAREMGVSEAEVARGILDDALLKVEDRGSVSRRGAAIREFFEEWDKITEKHGFPEGYVFDREELYDDRGYSKKGSEGDR